MVYDFHSHTFLSDGELSPLELAYRCSLHGYAALAITDHAGPGSLEQLLSQTVSDCELASARWGLAVLPGVELTYVPPDDIDAAALRAKELGALIVLVHGETVNELVPSGTNRAAARSSAVDVIAHPGLIDRETATIARDSGKFIELSARPGHGLANGHVASVCLDAGALMILNSDAHAPRDVLTEDRAQQIALAAGLSRRNAEKVLRENPVALLERLGWSAERTKLAGVGNEKRKRNTLAAG